jgi:hypothetical protein
MRRVSLLDQLAGALRSAEGMLSALGPEPKGDPAGMRALAREIRAEAEAAAEGGQAAAALPRSIVFRGPAAGELEMNAAFVSGAVSAAVSQLDSAAEQVEAEAGKIERAQHEWRHNRKRLEGQISSLAAQVRNAKP